MIIDWTIVVSTFTGAFLAAGTGYLFELQREKNRISSLRRIIKTAICDDLRHSLGLYEKVSEDYDKTKTVWFATLNEIRESLFTYQNNKDWVHVFDDVDLRRRIFKYYLQSAERINNLEYQQRRKDEIRARLNDLIRDIKLKDENIQHEEAIKNAISLMKGEDDEFNYLDKSIPEVISKISQLKTEAKELLHVLERVK